MFNVILVDDEPAILEGLRDTYDWKSYGFQVAGIARSGEKAFDLVRELHPDVVITDIRMRKMDGLELIRKCRDLKPDLEFVIISAHDDFEYAQQACSLGVFSYLLKPIEESEIMKVMKDLNQQCDTRYKSLLKSKEYRQLIDERKHEIEELLLKRYTARGIEEFELRRQLETINSDIDESLEFRVLCIDTNISSRILLDIDTDTHRFILSSAFTEQISKIFPTWSFELADGRVIIIIEESNKFSPDYNDFSSLIQKIANRIDTGKTKTLVTTFGSFQRGYSGILHSMDQALANFEHDVAIGRGNPQVADGHFPLPIKFSFYPQETAMQIVRSIRSNDNIAMKRYMHEFHSSPGFCNRPYRYFAYQRLCNDVSLYLLETAGVSEKQLGKIIKFSELIFRLNYAEIEKVFAEILSGIIDQRQDTQITQMNGRYDSRIRDVLLYINENIHYEQLSIQNAASQVFLNTAYLGRLFKQLIGMSFNQYLSRRRMEIASELLNTTDMTIQEISEHVGIPNSSYFSTVFKKYIGSSPSEYRG